MLHEDQGVIALKDGSISLQQSTFRERIALRKMCGSAAVSGGGGARPFMHVGAVRRLISMFLRRRGFDGHRAGSEEDVQDIGHLFFLAGLDSGTGVRSTACCPTWARMRAALKVRPRPLLIPHAVEEMLRWETPVEAVIRVTTEDTEVGGCPIAKGRSVAVMLASANRRGRLARRRLGGLRPGRGTATSPPAAAPTGASDRTCARMEAGSAWRSGTPDPRVPAARGAPAPYSQGLRSIDDLTLEWDV